MLELLIRDFLAFQSWAKQIENCETVTSTFETLRFSFWSESTRKQQFPPRSLHFGLLLLTKKKLGKVRSFGDYKDSGTIRIVSGWVDKHCLVTVPTKPFKQSLPHVRSMFNHSHMLVGFLDHLNHNLRKRQEWTSHEFHSSWIFLQLSSSCAKGKTRNNHGNLWKEHKETCSTGNWRKDSSRSKKSFWKFHGSTGSEGL